MGKVCTSCELDLGVESFSKRTASPDGLRPICKLCVKVYNKTNKERIALVASAYEKKNSAKIKEQNSSWRRNNRESVIESKRRYR